MSGYSHGWMERDSTIKHPSAEVVASSISQSLWDETRDFISQNFQMPFDRTESSVTSTEQTGGVAIETNMTLRDVCSPFIDVCLIDFYIN